MRNNYAFQKSINGKDIKLLRSRMEMTQADFAAFAGVSQKTVERWESGKEEITGPVTRIVRFLWEDPYLCRRYTVPEQILALRLSYYYNDILCTIIDVDEPHRHIEVVNFTKQYEYRAFGINDSPTFEEYEEFLESRCFPRSRDKMKLALQELNLPFYDPLMIIEKTGGRMAEDDFRVEIKRL